MLLIISAMQKITLINMNKTIKILLGLLFAFTAVYGGYELYLGKIKTGQNINAPAKFPETNAPQQGENAVQPKNETAPPIPESGTGSVLMPPLSSALLRVTKKPFGIKVSPGNSPVSPEKFSGYHTGVDFETFPAEENKDVFISAVCSGPILKKRIVSGYGGVIVQKCNVENIAVTVIYGHLRLSSIEKPIGAEISSGEKIGVLGRGYSAETAGERKHLHLGIHKGTEINYFGYVGSEKDLSGWIDAMKYLK
ncbi:MAG: peptidoglycan DD-metalloendopeptidase family protein [Minisyncoccia bacterium]